MTAYVLVIMTWITANPSGGWSISQQEYANMASCQNAAGIVTNMVKDKKKIQWACLPKEN